MLKFRFLPLALLVFSTTHAQNLIANGGFEDMNLCSEFAHLCSPEAWFLMPNKRPTGSRNLPAPLEGDKFGMVVMETLAQPLKQRIFLLTRLLCPLESGVTYKLHFLINPGRLKVFKIGVTLTDQMAITDDYLFHGKTPTLTITQKNALEILEDGWQEVEIVFNATGGEEYFTIGNFDPKAVKVTKKNRNKFEVKYLIDQVELVPTISMLPCPDRDSRRQALYDQNDRHSNLQAQLSPDLFHTIPAKATSIVAIEAVDIDPVAIDTVIVTVLKFVIPDIGFDFGKFVLNPTADPVLQTCLEQIKARHPSEVQILGFTDNVGSDAYNLELSLKRAMAVRQWFVEKHGLSPSIFVVKGLGESNPVATNDTETGRQANRRVEINFLK